MTQKDLANLSQVSRVAGKSHVRYIQTTCAWNRNIRIDEVKKYE
jgi:hypothetical protein